MSPNALHVCTTCRHPDLAWHRRGEPGGAAMPEVLRRALEAEGLAEHFDLRTYECLGSCRQRCRISVAGPRRWSWLFGKFAPDDDLGPFMRFLRQWLAESDGLVPKIDRPRALLPQILGRLPPA